MSVEEATRRSAVVWVELAAGTFPVWHVWHNERMYVVAGGDEQPLPATERAVVAVRSKDRPFELALRWEAAVGPVPPGSPEWQEVLPLLMARRLNPADRDAMPARWAEASTVYRFTPTGSALPG